MENDFIKAPHLRIEGELYGIELELECPGLYSRIESYDEESDEYTNEEPLVPPGWIWEEEESICGCEIVSEGPVPFEKALQDIHNLFLDVYLKAHQPLARTPRGSTHVHANISDLTWEQLKSFVMACAWAEPLLIEIAGAGRIGNLFAQPYEICRIGWANIINSICNKRISMPHDTHYMATSFMPIATLGSVEFRMGPSSRTAEEASDWLTLIATVVSNGRRTVVTDETPVWMEYLLGLVRESKRTRILEKCRRQAAEIWVKINQPPDVVSNSPLSEAPSQASFYSAAVSGVSEEEDLPDIPTFIGINEYLAPFQHTSPPPSPTAFNTAILTTGIINV